MRQKSHNECYGFFLVYHRGLSRGLRNAALWRSLRHCVPPPCSSIPNGAPDDTGAAQAGSCTGTQPRTGAQGANPPTYAHTGRSRAGVGTLLEATKFGRQNPLCARWNSPEQLLNWREAWASAVNRALEEKQQSARVTHLSHTALGLDEQLTAHEGSQARKLEMQGMLYCTSIF